jgi:hypothetical protein
MKWTRDCDRSCQPIGWLRRPGCSSAFCATWRESLLSAVPVCAAMLLAMLPVLPCGAQNGSAQPHVNVVPHLMGQGMSEFDDPSGVPSPENERLLRALNVDRQKSLVSDTNKLLRLVNELNAEIALANTGSLTPSQVRRVAEIEKLAHNVKEKMSTSVRVIPAFQAPFQSVHN